jgi:hypothetical protein
MAHLARPLQPGTLDRRRIPRQVAGLHSHVQDAPQQPVGLGDGSRRDLTSLMQLGQPGADRHRVDPPQRRLLEHRQQQPSQQIVIEGPRPRPQIGRGRPPPLHPLPERDPSQPRIGPGPAEQVGLDLGQIAVRIRLAGKCPRSCMPDPGLVVVADLPATGRQPAGGPEAPGAPPALDHQALASTRPAATKPARSPSAMRTWRPTLT